MNIEERNKKIVEMYRQGILVAKIAREFDISQSYVYVLATRAGIRRSEKNQKRNRKIVNDYLEGKPVDQIAKEFSVSTKTVYNLANKAGAKRRGVDHKPNTSSNPVLSKFCHLYGGVYTVSRISEIFGVNEKTVEAELGQ